MNNKDIQFLLLHMASVLEVEGSLPEVVDVHGKDINVEPINELLIQIMDSN